MKSGKSIMYDYVERNIFELAMIIEMAYKTKKAYVNIGFFV